MKACDEEKLLGHLGVVLYEYLGEEYPEVLGSILGALKVRLATSWLRLPSRNVIPSLVFITAAARSYGGQVPAATSTW